jgi:hypothetical protein
VIGRTERPPAPVPELLDHHHGSTPTPDPADPTSDGG